VSDYDYMLFVGNVNSCMYFWQNGEAEAYNSRQASNPATGHNGRYCRF